MGEKFKRNWKKVTGVRPPDGLPPCDILRVKDVLSGGSGIYRVTNVAASGYHEVTGGQEPLFELVVILSSGDYTIVLPEEPLIGKRYEIKDGAGDGCYPGVSKQIVPSGADLIEGIFTSFDLENCYQSWSFIYAGSNIWRFV